MSKLAYIYTNFTRWTIVTLFTIAPLLLSAQTRQPWEELLQQYALTEDIDLDNVSLRYDELSELSTNPINLNNSTAEQLRQLPFLTPAQYMRLVEYIDKVGVVHTWGELQVADIADARTLRLLQYFAYLGDPPVKNQTQSISQMLKYGKHEAIGYFKLPCYSRHGDDNGYQGYPYRHWIRYTFNCGQDIKAGFIGAQDAGEPFFAQPNTLGYDHYSFYVQVQNRGWLKSLVVGRYRLRMGSGLIINTNYSFGKLSAAKGMERQATTISGHSSRSDANYLQGVAATIDLSKHIEATTFISHRKIDATLNADSLTIATILKSGYHRTQSEIARKNNTLQTLWGGNIAYRQGQFRIGVTAVYNSYNRQLNPDTTTLYRRYAAMGNRFWNIGAEYSYLSPRIAFAGETATGNTGGIATLNRLTYTPCQTLSLSAIQRFYSYRYQALMSRGFAEGSQINNESGLCLSASWRMVRHWALLAYTDYAYFTWPRYGISMASHVWDNVLQTKYQHGNITWQTRYRIKLRQKDNATHDALIDYATHRAQTALTITSSRWTSKTQTALAYNSADNGSTGWSAGEQIRYSCKWLQATASVIYFDTDDYDSRIYSYEYGLLYSFSVPTFFGNGLHYALTARAEISKTFTLAAKVSTTHYMDRDHISSGLQQIDSNHQTDIEIQARVKF